MTYFKDLGLWFLSDQLANDTTATSNGEVDKCINPTVLSQWIQSRVSVIKEGGGGGKTPMMEVDVLQQCCREGKYWTHTVPSTTVS